MNSPANIGFAGELKVWILVSDGVGAGAGAGDDDGDGDGESDSDTKGGNEAIA